MLRRGAAGSLEDGIEGVPEVVSNSRSGCASLVVEPLHGRTDRIGRRGGFGEGLEQLSWGAHPLGSG